MSSVICHAECTCLFFLTFATTKAFVAINDTLNLDSPQMLTPDWEGSANVIASRQADVTNTPAWHSLAHCFGAFLARVDSRLTTHTSRLTIHSNLW
jgi:hypothetical protein